MTHAIVFVGPTLAARSARELAPGVAIAPPARCGDIYRAACAGYRAIALIDGYFDHRLSVWHKEILWVLALGIRVVGAASMGALRAAELEPFGMEGLGHVFEQYHSGELQDDDEVAVLHEGPETGFRAVSEAMVNLRASFAAAARSDALDDGVAQRAVEIAKSLFYGERTIERIARLSTSTARAAGDLVAWYRGGGAVDVKQADARAALARLSDGHTPAARPAFHFEHTHYWDAFLQQHARPDAGESPSPSPPQSAEAISDRELGAQLVEYLEQHDADGLEELWSAAAERACTRLLARSPAGLASTDDAPTLNDQVLALITSEVPRVLRELGTLDDVLRSIS